MAYRIDVPSSKSFGAAFWGRQFAYGIGEWSGVVESTEIRLRYARIDGVEFGDRFVDLFPTTRETEAIQSIANRLLAYPNPAESLVNLEIVLDAPRTISIEIVDVLGRRVEAPIRERLMGAGRNHLQWSAADISPGTYLLRVISACGILARTPLVVVR